MTRDGLIGIGCKTVAWVLIMFAVQGCSAQKEIVAVPSCIPLTAVSAATEDGAYAELKAHPEMVNTDVIVGDWISMRDDDRVCIAHQKNVQHIIGK